MSLKNIKLGLLPRIIIAIALGILLGGIMPLWAVRSFMTFNALFSEFLGFLIPLIIAGLVIPAIADIGRGAGRLLAITTLMAYAMTIMSGLLSYATSNTFFPAMIDGTIQLTTPSGNHTAAPWFSVNIPPLMDVMTALVMSFTVGIGLAYLNSSHLRNVANDFRSIISSTISSVIIPLLPIYIFGIFVNMVQEGQVTGVLSVFIKIIGIIFLLHIGVLLVQYIIAGAVSGRNPLRLLANMMPAYFTALGTQSSAATIPVTLRQTIKNGVSEGVAGFVIPLCATIHLSGSTLKIVACAMALMIMQGIPYDFTSMLGFIMMLGIAMVAAPGVPGGAIMASLGVLESMLGFSDTDQALMIALYIAMDSFGTACNVTGDGSIALIIDRISKNRR